MRTLSYTYKIDGSIETKIDARNLKTEYKYDNYRRVTEIRRYFMQGGQWTENLAARVTLHYDTNPVDGSFSQNGWGE